MIKFFQKNGYGSACLENWIRLILSRNQERLSFSRKMGTVQLVQKIRYGSAYLETGYGPACLENKIRFSLFRKLETSNPPKGQFDSDNYVIIISRYNTTGLNELALNQAFLAKIWKPNSFFLNGKQSFLHKITVPNRFNKIFIILIS